MELLLNLAWLLLALPAYWLWRSTRMSHAERKFSSLQCFLALGCMLVVLFPVISATDDLRAMRTEMEESPASKRSLRQVTGDKASPWNSRLQTSPSIVGAVISFLSPGRPDSSLRTSPSRTPPRITSGSPIADTKLACTNSQNWIAQSIPFENRRVRPPPFTEFLRVRPHTGRP